MAKQYKVILDCTPLQDKDSITRGIGRYLEQLIMGLSKLNTDHPVELLLHRHAAEPGWIGGLPHHLRTRYLEKETKRNFLGRIASQQQHTLVHFPAQYPFVPTPLPTVLTLHDVVPFVFRKTSYRYDLFAYALDRWFFTRITKRVHHIITISDLSKTDILKFTSIPEDRISVIHNGLDPIFTRDQPSHQETDAMEKKLGITLPYLLCIGSLEPRKNIDRMFESFSILKAKRVTSPPLQLVFLCWKRSEQLVKLNRLLHHYGLERDVLLPEFITKRELVCLYHGALLFYFPTLYEGFGYPPLEAMACGTPVVASMLPPFPELLGESAYLVNPFDPEAMAEGLHYLLSHPSARAELVRRGARQIERYNYVQQATQVLKLYEKIAKQTYA